MINSIKDGINLIRIVDEIFPPRLIVWLGRKLISRYRNFGFCYGQLLSENLVIFLHIFNNSGL